MAIGDKLFVADKPTLDAVKAKTDLIGAANPVVGGTDTIFKYMKKLEEAADYIFVKANDTLKLSSDAEVSAGGASAFAEVRKSCRIYMPGSVKIGFDFRGSVSGTSYGLTVLVNGALTVTLVAAAHTAPATYTNYELELGGLSPGDKIEILAKNNNSQDRTVYLRNFRVYYDIEYSNASNSGEII